MVFLPMELHATTKDGPVILSSPAVAQMRAHGLAPFHLLDTLEYGFEVAFPVAGLHEFVGFFETFTQVHIVAAEESSTDTPVGQTKILMCWSSKI